MKMRVAPGGIQTHDTLYSGQMVYQLSYQGSSAGMYMPLCTCYTCSQTIHVCLYMYVTYSDTAVHLVIPSL